MRRTSIVLIICGVLFLAGAGAWTTFAGSKLVKLPLNTNTTLQYTGHFVTYVNASTGAALARPVSTALTIDRTIKGVASESSSSTAILTEHLALHYAGTTLYENNVYAINRTSMDNVASARAYTFARGNPYPAVGSYYLTLPMNIKPGVTRMNIWKPETATTYPLVALRSGAEPSSLDGLSVAWFSGVLPLTPVAPYERTALAQRGLPMTITPASVEAKLTSEGVPVAALTATLIPKLTPTQLHEVLTVLSTPVALHYYAFGSGLVATNTRTGAIIKLQSLIDGIAVAPETNGLHTLIGVMTAYPSVKGVPAALRALRTLAAAPPQPVYELQYTQTPAAVALMVSNTKSQLRQISLVTYYIPIGLLVLGLLLLAGGIVLRLRRRRMLAALAVPTPVPTPSEEPKPARRVA
ncbi:MAG TPA: porin PorA family protein [Acidimicrobiales bacterium]|nr:porin PorA family protein [Acidimicrobiales bacterium]